MGGSEQRTHSPERKRLLQLYPDEKVVLRVVNRPAVTGAINLSPEEFQILFFFAGGRALNQVLNETKRPATELYPLVHRLQSNGLLEVAGPDPDATTRNPPQDSIKTLIEPREQTPPEPKARPPVEATVPPPPVPRVEPKPKVTPSVEARLKQVPEPKAKPSVEAKIPPRTGSRATPSRPISAGATRSEKKPVLIGTLTSDDGTMHPLIEDVTTIGRVSANDIILDDASVSTKHARVHRTAEGFVMEDLRSRNGTFINSDKVTEKRLLVDADLVRLGKVILTFNLAVEMRQGSSTQELIPK